MSELNFSITTELIKFLEPYISGLKFDIENNIESEKEAGIIRKHKSDYVKIDKKNKVGFDVLENEIIVFFFNEHCHFEDYTSSFDVGEDDYIKRAKEFLSELFQYKIRNTKYFKGGKLYSEKYYIIYPDDREDNFISGTMWSILRRLSPFGERTEKTTVWSYDSTKGCFTNKDEKKPDDEAVEIIDISDDCYVEIFFKHNAYTYNIMVTDYDDYYCRYFWAPAKNILEPEWYDTKEKAAEEAIIYVKSINISE